MTVSKETTVVPRVHPWDTEGPNPLWVLGPGYRFLSDLLRVGAERPLQAEDVAPLPTWLQAGRASARLRLPETLEVGGLRKMMWTSLWKDAAFIQVHIAWFILCKLSTPLAFWWLLRALKGESGFPWWHCYASAALLGILCYGISVFVASANCKSAEMGILVRQGMSALVFDAVLRLPASGFEVGTTSAALTVDVERLYLLCNDANMIGAAVGMISVGMILVATQVGWVGALVSVIFLGAVQFLQQRIQGRIRKARAQMSASTDRRVALSAQLWQGIRAIRMSGWDPSLREQIEGTREPELRALWVVMLWKALNLTLSAAVPVLVTTFVLAMYAVVEGQEAITPERVLVVLSIVNPCIRTGFDFLPRLLAIVSEASVALTRIERLVLKTCANGSRARGGLDLLPAKEVKHMQSSSLVELNCASFTWPGAAAESFRLQDINFSLSAGSLVCILGEVGAGKSALIAAILGELPRVEGTAYSARAPSRIEGTGVVDAAPILAAHCGQQPWIQSCSIRENVFPARAPSTKAGTLNEKRYQQALRAAQLSRDIELWPEGDATNVGERGLTLSGGQKARVALARAAYSVLANSVTLVLLDDVLAALDGPVAQSVVEECVLGAMAGAARVVVLSSPHAILKHADKVLIVEHGRVREAHAGEIPVPPSALTAVAARATQPVEPKEVLQSPEESPDATKTSASKDGKASNAEQRRTGSLSVRAVAQYFGFSSGSRQANYFHTSCIFTLFIVTELSRIALDTWLTFWASAVSGDVSGMGALGDFARETNGVAVALCICAVATVFAGVRSCFFMRWAHGCSRHLFLGALRSVAGASLTEFFDVTPSGRILSCFTRDCDVLDSVLPDLLHTNLMSGTDLLLILVLCAVAAPTYLALVPPLVWYSMRTRVLFGASARELKRLDGVTRSPVLTLAVEAMQGLMPLRAAGVSPAFRDSFHELLDENGRHFFHLAMLTPWMILRLNLVATVFVLGIGLSAAALRDTLPHAMLGLAVAHGLNIMGKFQTLTRWTVELEQQLTSSERLDALRDAPTQPGPRSGTGLAPGGWPQAGRVELQNVCVRYRASLPLVLTDVSFAIPGGTKLGVVGRSGCGKSSLMQTILRLVEPSAGRVLIDGIDLQDLDGGELRRRLAVIPQDPYLWRGDLRNNLDPTRTYTDEQMLDALDACSLRARLAALGGSAQTSVLDIQVEDAGGNLSVGERQLLCLCRAILRRSALCLLDEATANIDSVSEAQIQKALGEVLSASTVIVIAHRLQTVSSSDLVLRLDAGRVASLGPPSEVLVGVPDTCVAQALPTAAAATPPLADPTALPTSTDPLLSLDETVTI